VLLKLKFKLNWAR